MKKKLFSIVLLLSFGIVGLFLFDRQADAESFSYNIYLYEDYFVYTGEEVTPEIQKVTIEGESGEVTLREGMDYIVRYTNNINAGMGTVTIFGRGTYSGSAESQFVIYEKELTLSNCQYSIIYSERTPQTPTLQLTCDGVMLFQNIDYTIAYENNKNITDDSVILVTGTDNYSGRFSIPFTIPTKDISLYGVFEGIESMEYTGEALTQTFSLSYVLEGESENLSLTTDYTVSFTNNINVGKATIVVNGCGNYTGSLSTTFSIVPKSITNCTSDAIKNYVYTTKPLLPLVVLSDQERILKKDNDYVLFYRNNVNVGTAIIEVVGRGNYTGRLLVNFDILEKDISRMKVFNVVNKEYTGREISQRFLQVPGLVKGRDYKVRYEDNTDIGKATVILEGCGNYTGEKVLHFRILKKKSTCNRVKRVLVQKTPTSSTRYQLHFSWNEPVGAAGYEIYKKKVKCVPVKKKQGGKIIRKKVKKISWQRIKKTKNLSCTIKNIKTGKKPVYKIRAYKIYQGKTVYSSYSSIKRR